MKGCPVCHSLHLSSFQNCGTCVQVLQLATVRFCPNGCGFGAGPSCVACGAGLVEAVAKQCPKCNRQGDTPLSACPDCVQPLVEMKYCPTCNDFTDGATCSHCTGATQDKVDKTCTRCNRLFLASESVCSVCAIAATDIPGTRCVTCNLDFSPMESVCGACNGPLVPIPERQCPLCMKILPPGAPYCDVCGVQLVDLGAKSTPKRTRALDGDILVQKSKVTQDVKGAKKKITVTVDMVEWTLGDKTRTFARPCLVEARIQRTAVKKPRKGPPVPLSVKDPATLIAANVATEETGEEEGLLVASDTDDGTEDTVEGAEGEAEKESETLGDLEEFDKGHLVALFLGGADNSWQIVPQVRGCNRDTWLQMERAIHDIAGRKTSLAGTIGLALEEVNTIALQSIVMRIHVLYADRRGEVRTGDPRIPVWFYVQLFLKDKAIGHFSIANQPRKRTAWPTDDEVAWFKYAHVKLGIPIPDHECTFIPDAARAAFRQKNYLDAVAELLTVTRTDNECYLDARDGDDDTSKSNRILKDALSTTSGPLRALQWLFNQGVLAHTMKPAPFEGGQIEIIRKYNLWLNGGTMTSDAAIAFADRPWNAGEKPDPFPRLDEGSGQAYPEVDHILPKKSGGLNSYSNARLVSFSLNHIYREKPGEPPSAAAFGVTVKRDAGDFAYGQFCLRFADDKLKAGKVSMTGPNHGAQFREQIRARKSYLLTMERLHARALKQATRADEFDNVRQALRAGYESFLSDPGPELKTMMWDYAFRLPFHLRGTKQLGLNDVSDEIPALTTI